MIVNGQSQVLAFLPTKDGNSAAASVLNVQLNQGSGNSIRIEGVNAGWGKYWFSLLFRCLFPDEDLDMLIQLGLL